MPIEIPIPLVEFILLGPADDWVQFGASPGKALDLLISPYKTQHAGHVAATIANDLDDSGDDKESASIAYLQGLLLARLTFEELLTVVVPKTQWWIDRWTLRTEAPKREAADRPKEADFVHEATQRYFEDGGASFTA